MFGGHERGERQHGTTADRRPVGGGGEDGIETSVVADGPERRDRGLPHERLAPGAGTTSETDEQGVDLVPDDLPPPIRARETVAVPTEAGLQSLRDARDAFERAYILGELRIHDWNITRTAQALGIGRVNLWRKLKAYGISVPRKG